jgi:hypothetical protein
VARARQTPKVSRVEAPHWELMLFQVQAVLVVREGGETVEKITTTPWLFDNVGQLLAFAAQWPQALAQFNEGSPPAPSPNGDGPEPD